MLVQRRFDWAILPEKREFKRVSPISQPAVNSFKWHANVRDESSCLPRNLGLQIGLYVLSPVSISLDPIDEVQFHCSDDELSSAVSENGFVECWNRGDTRFGFRSSTNFRQFDFRVDQHWESMFVPNGNGTVEWRLGYNIDIDDNMGLLVAPLDDLTDAVALYGFIPSNSLKRMSASSGFSIALRIFKSTRIEKGQEIARIIPLPLSVFRQNTEFRV